MDPATTSNGSRWFRWLRWRLALLLVVYALGLLCWSVGVEASDRDLSQAGMTGRLYYALGLFVFGGMDLGTPTGGPPWARSLLWVVYFAAPGITTGALVEAGLRILGTTNWRLRRTRGHVVIVGGGRLAQVYLRRLRECDRRRTVVVVDREPLASTLQLLSGLLRVHFVQGDVADPAIFASLRIPVADRVALLTGDDHINLDAAARIAQSAPQLDGRVLVHVADIRLLRTIEQRGLLPEVTFFNSYRTAARHLVEKELVPHFEETRSADSVVLAGFGRYGQTVLDELQRRAHDHLVRVVIVDAEAEKKVAVFAEQVGFEGDRHRVVQADLGDPRTWGKIDELLDPSVERPVFVLCSGDDSLNLRASLRLSSRYPSARILARCFHGSAFTERVCGELDLRIVSTSDLLASQLDGDGLLGGR